MKLKVKLKVEAPENVVGQFRDPDWLKLRRKDALFLADYPVFCAKSYLVGCQVKYKYQPNFCP